jgi:hypothetical protein
MSKWLLAGLLGLAGCGGAVHENALQDPVEKDTFAEQAQLSPQSYLRKLSFHIRGLTPEAEEYRKLDEALKNHAQKEFFRGKIDEYLASQEHIDKMAFRLEELFLLQPSAVPFYSPLRNAGSRVVNDYSIDNSMNDLFREIASRNLSWDNLLTAKHYTAHPLKVLNASVTSDLLFYSSISGTSPGGTESVQLKYGEDDARVAGALTTSRFFNRYANTALNKNRRRAAAVFRVFMCDDMKAVVVDEKGNQNDILNRVFPGTSGGGGKGGMGDDRHGSDKACMKCHYKLDPLGLSFQSSGLVLSPFASAGALDFKRADGTEVNIAARGLAGIGEAISQQPEYVRCQVQHFWKWFIGQDRFLEPATLDELAAKFEDVHRRPNDFIAYLVGRPEFGYAGSSSKADQQIYQVKTILQNCNGCHAEKHYPSFTQWPIGGSKNENTRWLALIKRDLALDGGVRKMPPASSAWQLDAEQVAVLKAWLKEQTDAK